MVTWVTDIWSIGVVVILLDCLSGDASSILAWTAEALEKTFFLVLQNQMVELSSDCQTTPELGIS